MVKNQERAENYWKQEGVEFNEFYGRVGGFSPRKIISRFLEKRTKTLREFIGEVVGKNILDLGCGSGVQMREFAPSCQKIVGVDISEPMLEAARKLLKALPKRNWELFYADARHLPFADQSFGIIFTLGLLDYVADSGAVLRECRRLLKPGGSIIFTIPKKPSPFSFFRTPSGIPLRRWLFHLPPIVNVVSKKKLAHLAEICGLSIINAVSIWQTMWMVKAKKI